MPFIEKLVGPEEKLIGIARLHWIYGVKGLAWLAGFMALGGAINWALITVMDGALMRTAAGAFLTIGNAAFWVCLLIGVTMFITYFIMMLATEIGLTTERLIYKKGLIFVKTEGIDLEEIKGAYVDNEMLGRLLNYGTIRFDARFIHDLPLPAVADPYRFVKALNDQRSHMKEDSMHVVLDKGHGHARDMLKHQLENGNESRESKEPEHHLEDQEYKVFDDVDPLAPFHDIAQEVGETARQQNHQAKKQTSVAMDSLHRKIDKDAKNRKNGGSKLEEKSSKSPKKPRPPVVFSELKEGMLEEFDDSTHH